MEQLVSEEVDRAIAAEARDARRRGMIAFARVYAWSRSSRPVVFTTSTSAGSIGPSPRAPRDRLDRGLPRRRLVRGELRRLLTEETAELRVGHGLGRAQAEERSKPPSARVKSSSAPRIVRPSSTVASRTRRHRRRAARLLANAVIVAPARGRRSVRCASPTRGERDEKRSGT